MIFGVTIAFLFLFEGSRSIYRFVRWVFQWQQSQRWRTTHGRIIQSTVQSVQIPRGGRRSLNWNGSTRLVTAYTPNIVYEYRADAASLQSRQIFLAQQFPSSLNFSDSFVEKYPVGKDVTVFYDPEKPNVAVLERGWHKEVLGHLTRGLLYVFFGFAILMFALRQ